MTASILNHPLISERYFFPRPDSFERPFWVDCGPVRLGCYYHHQHPNAKTVVHFHGNGEVVSDYLADFVPAIDRLGYNCFLAEYRGYGMSTGRPALVEMLADVEQIIPAIGQPPEKMVLFGRSVGSIYALHGASCFPNIAGLIIESGIADPLERLLLRVHPQEVGAIDEQIRVVVDRELNHQAKLAKFKGAALIMHTRHDGLVDVSHAQRLYQWAPQPKTLKIFEQGSHNDILFVNFAEYFQTVQAFMQGLPAYPATG